MIGILLITHGTLGECLIQTAMHMLNKRPAQLRQLCLTPQDNPQLLLPQAQALVQELNDGDGVLVLTDMYGGSPSNIAATLIVPGKVDAVAGVNLPMLMRALTYRETALEVMLNKAISGGCEGVLRVPAAAPVVTTLHHAATGS